MREWWAYWVTEGFGEQATFRGWMYLSPFDAQHLQSRVRLAMGESGENVSLVNYQTGQEAQALVFI